MRQGSGTSGPGERTFIEQARRAQIVDAAIEAIAELGYVNASLARIAKWAGTSKGVITYHFAGKEDLIQAVVAEVFGQGEAYMTPRILAAGHSGASMLRAYIESNLAYMSEHRNHLVAIVEIAVNARDDHGNRLFDDSVLDAGVSGLEEILTHFQASGEFRAGFSPRAMAVTIRGAIDSMPPRLSRDPALDLESYGREMADIFDRATRAEPGDQAEREDGNMSAGLRDGR
jgi:TetR/AcrR family transcriptional regulator, fatty acid metabolism regulator protein